MVPRIGLLLRTLVFRRRQTMDLCVSLSFGLRAQRPLVWSNLERLTFVAVLQLVGRASIGDLVSVRRRHQLARHAARAVIDDVLTGEAVVQDGVRNGHLSTDLVV